MRLILRHRCAVSELQRSIPCFGFSAAPLLLLHCFDATAVRVSVLFVAAFHDGSLLLLIPSCCHQLVVTRLIRFLRRRQLLTSKLLEHFFLRIGRIGHPTI